MNQNLTIGNKGEDLATEYLIKKGYAIVYRNIKANKAEIDIVATTQNILVFVEVKTRKNNYFGYPEEAVNARKEGNIAKAASSIREQLNHENEIRFDIISITLEPQIEIHHIEDAFFPGL